MRRRRVAITAVTVTRGIDARIVVSRRPRQTSEAMSARVGAPGWDDTWYPCVVLPVTWTLGGAGWDNVRGMVAPRADGVVSRSYRVSGTLAAP